MSDPLLVTFQTQLSGIMETILRSAVLEITRLVEGSLLEQVGRGKQEADVLRRRLQITEAKLAERQRVKRVRCADCGRTGLSKKDGDGRDSRTQAGAEVVCFTKQETISEGGRKSCDKGVTPGQEETSAIPDTEHKIAEVEGEKMGGTVKEEDTVAAERQIFSTEHCRTADHRASKIHNVSETPGIRTLQSDLRLPPRDKLPVSKSHSGSSQDSKARTHLKKPASKSEQQVHSAHPQSEPAGPLSSEVSPAVSQLVNSPDSVAIKQEVVVVLPSDWGELERGRSGITSTLCRLNQGQEELHTVSSGASEERRVYPGPCVKDGLSPQVIPVTKQPKPAQHASMPTSSPNTGSAAQGPSFPKSPLLPKPSQSFPQFQRAYADERAVGALQSGRSPQQTHSSRTHGHLGGHAARRPYICSHCGKVFSQLCHLKGHQQIHTGERQFCCSLCGRSFTKLSNLKAHRRVHTGERPYICMDCGKRFTQKCNLKRHQRIHSAHL